MTTPGYVHGYSPREAERLLDQATTLTELLHGDTRYPSGSRVLEAGCGVGAQTVELIARSPGVQLTAVDVSAQSLAEARARLGTATGHHVDLVEADLYALPFADRSFDHVFVCFVLEHLADPAGAVRHLLRVLRPGGSLTVIEGDHGSACFHPEAAAARRAIACLVQLQAAAGGDACIGRRLYPLLAGAGLRDVRVSPRLVYADASRPALVEGFTRRTFTAMVAAVEPAAVAAGLATHTEFRAGVAALERTAAADGTFAYTFFKAVGTRAP